MPVPISGHHQFDPFFVHRRPSLGERILNSPLRK
jgi:hypothetical protein